MKKILCFALILVLAVLTLSGCGGDKFDFLNREVPQITVSSNSINSSGRLYTTNAAGNSNNPQGDNKNPHIKWSAVEGAGCYAVVIFDTTANWLHMIVLETNYTEIAEGTYPRITYVGPYPPENSGIHQYRIEVFALKAAPDNLSFTVDSQLNYKSIVEALDANNSQNGNILARGFIIGKYAYGDNTVK